MENKLPQGLNIPLWEHKHASALQAIAYGRADENQQKLALDFIINNICLTYDMPYRPDSQRDTDFLLGRMFCGQQIVKLLKTNLNNLKEKTNGRQSSNGSDSGSTSRGSSRRSGKNNG